MRRGGRSRRGRQPFSLVVFSVLSAERGHRVQKKTLLKSVNSYHKRSLGENIGQYGFSECLLYLVEVV